ncbi:MAG: hypothetical protein GX916_10105 [Clostridiales bacterium]|jgi:hypothetical protein|nr:hypothetical protein [Clostridiales bacterium]
MKFEAGNKSYELRYTINSIADLEEQTKRPFSEIFKLGEFSAMRALFWAGLIDSNPKLTIRAAGQILTDYFQEGHTMDDVVSLVNAATEQAGFLEAQTAAKR